MAPVATSKHWIPEQQGAVTLHAWEAVPQVAGGVQTPFVQVSVALQHCTVAEQLWLVLAHTEAAAQVPEVAPAGMAQEAPAQQSLLVVQVPPTPWQEEGVPEPPLPSAQVPLTHEPLQQSVAAVALVQTPPASLHVVDDAGSRQA